MPELEGGIPPLEDDPPSGNGETPKRRGRPPGSISKLKLDELTEKLSTQLINVTMPLGIVSPLGYDYLCDQAEDTARALSRIAAKNPKARKALEKFATGSDWAEVIKLPIGVGIGMMIDMQRVRPDTLLGRPFGMQTRIQRLYGEEGSETVPEYNGSTVNARGMAGQI